MKITFYGTRDYDHLYFDVLAADPEYGCDIRFLAANLDKDTAPLAAGGEAVCAFVNADGSAPVLETLAAVSILRKELPELKIRVVNVVDLMKLQPHTEHPHGLTDEEYDGLFTKDKPIIFAYHGYPTLVHELTYRRHNRNLHVRGYKEEGTITTPFDMRVLNDIDRFDLVIDTVRRLPQLGNRGAYLVQKMQDKLVEHRQYIRDNGVDLPEIRSWKWDEGLNRAE